MKTNTNIMCTNWYNHILDEVLLFLLFLTLAGIMDRWNLKKLYLHYISLHMETIRLIK